MTNGNILPLECWSAPIAQGADVHQLLSPITGQPYDPLDVPPWVRNTLGHDYLKSHAPRLRLLAEPAANKSPLAGWQLNEIAEDLDVIGWPYGMSGNVKADEEQYELCPAAVEVALRSAGRLSVFNTLGVYGSEEAMSDAAAIISASKEYLLETLPQLPPAQLANEETLIKIQVAGFHYASTLIWCMLVAAGVAACGHGLSHATPPQRIAMSVDPLYAPELARRAPLLGFSPKDIEILPIRADLLTGRDQEKIERTSHTLMRGLFGSNEAHWHS